MKDKDDFSIIIKSVAGDAIVVITWSIITWIEALIHIQEYGITPKYKPSPLFSYKYHT